MPRPIISLACAGSGTSRQARNPSVFCSGSYDHLDSGLSYNKASTRESHPRIYWCYRIIKDSECTFVLLSLSNTALYSFVTIYNDHQHSALLLPCGCKNPQLCPERREHPSTGLYIRCDLCSCSNSRENPRDVCKPSHHHL